MRYLLLDVIIGGKQSKSPFYFYWILVILHSILDSFLLNKNLLCATFSFS